MWTLDRGTKNSMCVLFVSPWKCWRQKRCYKCFLYKTLQTFSPYKRGLYSKLFTGQLFSSFSWVYKSSSSIIIIFRKRYIYKIRCVLRTLLLVSYCVYIRLCKHDCNVTAYFPVLFYKRNRKWTRCVYVTWYKHSRVYIICIGYNYTEERRI